MGSQRKNGEASVSIASPAAGPAASDPGNAVQNGFFSEASCGGDSGS